MPETTHFTGMEGDGTSDAALKANFVLHTRYKIMGVLGGGGMGTVYQARDLNFTDVRKLVAIKEMQTIASDQALRASMLKTFRREANILATLNHPAIPKIFDFFDLNDRAYLVMEYINGSDLELLLSKTKELPIDKVVEWAGDLCDVLEYLHNQKPDPIVFRDMKPSNVMIDSLGKVRLIDFGIAKTFVSGIKHTMIGTEGYSAPEQYKGDVTPQSDIYSLGATLHHLLTRKDPRLEPPFSFHERPITTFNAKAPPELVAIIERALSFNVTERFKSCAEMKEALDRLRYRPMAVPIGMAAPPSTNGGTGFFEEEAAQTGTVQPKWKFKTEDEIRCNPTTVREIALVGSYDTNMWALKLQTGELLWKFPTRGGIASSPVVDEASKLVIFGSEDNSLYAVDFRSGRISWSYVTKDRVRGTPRIAHEHVFFGSDDGKIYALGVATGRFLWSFDMSNPVRSRPFVSNELVIVGCESGEVIALGLSGSRKWSYRTKRGVISSPHVNEEEGIVYVGSTDGFMYALDVLNGYNSWRFRTNGPIISSPISHKGYLYFGSADGSLYCLNAQTSRERWKFTTEKPIVSSPIVARNYVFFGGTDGYFYCVDADTGRERWKFKTGGAITSMPIIAGDLILVGSMDHTLYAFPLVS
jgi:outer membrane protein assembly factor BamB/tRNA A-37 threonylcarbamoyl transferase component Bud32